MSQKKRTKSAYSGGKDPALLQNDRDNKKLDPLARRLLYAAVVLVGAAQVLDSVLQLIPRAAGDVMTLGGLILLVAALAVQSRSTVSYRDRSRGRRL